MVTRRSATYPRPEVSYKISLYPLLPIVKMSKRVQASNNKDGKEEGELDWIEDLEVQHPLIPTAAGNSADSLRSPARAFLSSN